MGDHYSIRPVTGLKKQAASAVGHMVYVAIILLRCLSQLLFALPLLYELE